MNQVDKRPVVVVIGGGPVGALNAIFFAKTNKFDVMLFEKREDIRQQVKVSGRSINLTISHRARSALREVGLEEEILKLAIPMYSRMIHRPDGSLVNMPYGSASQCLMAIDRRCLNELLVTSAEKCPNVDIKFNHKLVHLNLKSKTAIFSTENGDVEVNYDLLVGNDGAYSSVRQSMMRHTRVDFSQEYISHGYMELYFPPLEGKQFSMSQNCLHIWPRDEFMMISMPNPGGSFTGTLFMPFDIFDTLKSEEDLLNFFRDNFPDALELIGMKRLTETFFVNKPSSLVTIKCSPYHFEESCVLMGDAAHAMVPFYGQGMNAGFEDLIIFHEILRQNQFKLDKCCSLFTERRNQDAKAICELALFNYVEMRKSVNSKWFLIRKCFDNTMNRIFPSFWIPLYTMVTFSRSPYTKCIQERKKQDKILSSIGYLSVALLASASLMGFNSFVKNYSDML